MGFLLKFVGGKLGGVWLVAAIAAGGWGLIQTMDAKAQRDRADQLVADKAVITERLGQVAKTANQNAEAARRARQEAEAREALVARHRDTIDELRADLDARVVTLEEATDAAPVEYQACMRVPVPGDVLRALRVRGDPRTPAAGGRDKGPDRVRQAAGEPAEGVSGA